MAFSRIKELLHKSIGLHAETVGESSIDRAINYRMNKKKCNTGSDYYNILKVDVEEFSELIEEVVVPETWFFRNIAPFEVLRNNAAKIYKNTLRSQGRTISNKDKNGLLKILSIPCSSGEEPYSIAMAIRESGLSEKNYCIDAIDISQRSIKKAQRAIYGKHSFREKGLGLQEKYFEKTKSGFRLFPEIRDRVSFKQGNILEDQISPSVNYYDIIFCRNLLIYFDRDTQKIILDKLSRMLKGGGLLFVGHAEAGQIDKNKYTKIRAAKAFSFRKKLIGGSIKNTSLMNDQPVDKLKDIYDQLVEVTKKDIELSKRIKNPKYRNTIKKVKKPIGASFFSKIDKLVDTGQLSDAYEVCEAVLKNYPESADAYYYLGLISSLQGSYVGSEVFLRKAIYLSPTHRKALSLSVILAEKRGDTDSAQSLRRREQKARKRNS